MSVFLVTWDLNKQRLNYDAARDALIKHLERYSHIKDPGLDSVWFIQASLNAATLTADIRTKLDANDKLVVTQLVSGQHDGWLQTDVWTWINARL